MYFYASLRICYAFLRILLRISYAFPQRNPVCTPRDWVWRGLAGYGVAWLGMARPGWVWRGLAWVWRGLAGYGVAWLGMAWPGWVNESGHEKSQNLARSAKF